MDSNPARLIVRYGPSSEEEYALTHDTTNLGREPFNDIVLNLPELSRRHARIIMREGRHFLEDLNSTNGTTLNGRRVTETEALQDGDEIDLAESVGFRFAAPPAETVALPTPDFADQDTPRRPMTAVVPDFDPEPAELPPPVPPPAPADYSYQAPQPTPYTPPPVQEPLVPAAPEPSGGGGCRRFLIGCFLVVVVLSVLVIGTLVVLDSVAPNLLYCGPMEPLVQAVADILTLLGFGRIEPLACPIV